MSPLATLFPFSLGMLVTASHMARGEERTVQAMAPLQGSGEVFVVAPEKFMILVSFTGIMYLHGTQGAPSASSNRWSRGPRPR
jgi:hypothetical protein